MPVRFVWLNSSHLYYPTLNPFGAINSGCIPNRPVVQSGDEASIYESPEDAITVLYVACSPCFHLKYFNDACHLVIPGESHKFSAIPHSNACSCDDQWNICQFPFRDLRNPEVFFFPHQNRNCTRSHQQIRMKYSGVICNFQESSTFHH